MLSEKDFQNSTILIVDDEPTNVHVLERILKEEGYSCLRSTTDSSKVREIYQNIHPDLVLLDLKMPAPDGFKVMEQLKEIEKDSYLPVLVLTAQRDDATHMRALKAGARDFLGKPFNASEVLCRIRNLLEVRLLHNKVKEQNISLDQKVRERTANLAEANRQLGELRKQLELENIYLREEVQSIQSIGPIVGHSPALQKVLEQAKLVANTDSTVLIEGETGTGKELIARAIHEKSKRNKRSWVKVNCGAVPSELFESEFFGHLKGAFTGAIKDRLGRFQLAEGGTLFLDEIAEIPLGLQVKLLRVLQEGQFESVGDDKTRQVDVRIIAATNRDLKEEVRCRRFREDLYFRLSVIPIHVPPLRERKEDIEPLAYHILDKVCKQLKKKKVKLSKENIQQLQYYDWPGNIREMQNVIERAVIISQDKPLHFDLAQAPSSLGSQNLSSKNTEIISIEEEKHRSRGNILVALEKSNWKIYGSGGAAELLNIHPQTLSNKIKKLGLKKPR